jgi:hypothetical protein
MLDTWNFPDYLGLLVDTSVKTLIPIPGLNKVQLLIYRLLAYFSGVRQ